MDVAAVIITTIAGKPKIHYHALNIIKNTTLLYNNNSKIYLNSQSYNSNIIIENILKIE